MKFGEFIPPMLLKEMPKPFDDEEFLYEIKFDGIRAMVHVGAKTFKIFSRRGQDITELYPELKEIGLLVKDDVIFDGEIVYFDKDKPNFTKLMTRNRLKDKKKINFFSKNNPVTFVAFDCIYKNKPLINKPLFERKKILEKYPDTRVFLKTQYIFKDGIKLFNKVVEVGLEGIIAKKIDSIYEIGTRTHNWIKIKNFKKESFLVGGYIYNSQKISLLLGELKNDKLHFVGKVSIPMSNPLYKKILKVKKLQKTPFENTNIKANYIEPIYKVKIAYMERTESNNLRQPIFIGEIKGGK